MGFHFAAFALNDSAYPDNLLWYQTEFLGCGAYAGNTWRPTPALLRIELPDHPIMENLPIKWTASPNEWYKWERDLKANDSILILLAIDSESFPLGTGPKEHEIWHSGYYPVVWTNRNYRMVYLNMGHNDMDYENGSGRQISFSFTNETQK